MPDAVIVDVVRTPGGKRNGSLSGWHPADLAGEVLSTLVERNDLDPALIEDVLMGCVSQVFITAKLDDGKVLFSGDSDAQLVKGLVGFLLEGLSGLTPNEIIKLKPDFIKDTGLDMSLTPSRANGFYNIFKLMQQKAIGLE